MLKFLIRLFSFFGKEINEIRRQPRLILSLILGPFLILLLFGAGYQNNRPVLRTALVLPVEGIEAVDVEALANLINTNFTLVEISYDRDEMMRKLSANQLDVVQVLPSNIEEQVLAGQQSNVEFFYNTINPLNEQWIQYLAYAQVGEINRAILLQNTTQMQQEASDIKAQLAETRQQLDTLNSNLSAAKQADVQRSLRDLRQALDLLALSPVLLRLSSSDQLNPQQTRRDLVQLQADLETIDAAISAGQLEQQQTRIRETRERVAQMEETVGTLSQLPPEVIVSPLQQYYANVRGQSLDLMAYYAPGVVALLIQHIAVTLGALSLVRERNLGAIEIFRVAPVSSRQMLIGKYLSFTVFIGLIAAVLGWLLYVLDVPFLGSPLYFAGLVLLLTLAALGMGLLISAISRSDSQAVQLSMLVLLLSIFFSGFFLPLENFWAPVRVVGYVLPLTHGISGFQDVLLRGLPPTVFTWSALGLISAVTFVAVAILVHLQFRRA